MLAASVQTNAFTCRSSAMVFMTVLMGMTKEYTAGVSKFAEEKML